MAVEFGKYQLLQRIGSGGMGQVFLARTVGTQDFEKLIVIKRLLPHLSEDEEFLSMFLDEARIAARLNHPNLIQIFELGDFGSSHYLAMEYVAGEDLRRLERFLRTTARKLLPLGVVCRVIADAAAGLDYAHKARDSQGRPLALVHRDVSPQNILVGFDGAVKLIDFGVAKAAGKIQHTASGMLKGKYPYMSPEQAQGLELDGRSDIFSLGIIFWELLTGKRLFKGDSEVSTLRLVSACQVPPPSRLAVPDGANVDALVMKALARDADARYPDAASFRLAIEEFILEHRLQASSAHLAAFMHGLYEDRINHLADPSALDQLQGELEPGATPASGSYRSASVTSGSREPSSGARADPQAATTPSRGRFSNPNLSAHGASAARVRASSPTLPARREVTQAVPSTQAPPPATRGARWLVLASMLLGGLLAVGVAVMLSARTGPSPRVQAGAPPLRPEEVARPPADVPPAAKPLSSGVVLTLASEPAGATVRVGARELGATPVDYPLAADAEPVVAVFSLQGYESREAAFSAKDAPLLSVQLTRKKPKPPAHNLGIKTGR